jgi:hypothetical protein
MENLEWFAVPYNGLETNIEVTQCGRVRRVKKDWMQRNRVIGEIDFNKLKTPNRYTQISIKIKAYKSKTIYVHQLIAAAFLNYKWQGQKLVVDHIDSNKDNNHVNNLRLITSRENISKERSLKSGLPTGVYFYKRDKKYRAAININRKYIYLGNYNTPEEASQAYENKLKTLLNQ